MNYTTRFRLSFAIFQENELKKTGDQLFTQLKVGNQSVTINLDANTEQEAFDEVKKICELVTEKSSQALLKKEFREKMLPKNDSTNP